MCDDHPFKKIHAPLLPPKIMRDGPFYMVFFGSYELMNSYLLTSFPALPSEASNFFAGGMAGTFGWAAVMPFDGPKSIIQASWSKRVVGDFPGVFAQVARERGVSGLYAGLGPAVVRAFPANGALFVGYEAARAALAPL
mmetsp:Transcript_16045/g.37243  ORF Transcript_16045/g.37243 Transcript_16045/m.37243 type:complete len:139 (+) Transcript_16045:771-1187(+)